MSLPGFTVEKGYLFKDLPMSQRGTIYSDILYVPYGGKVIFTGFNLERNVDDTEEVDPVPIGVEEECEYVASKCLSMLNTCSIKDDMFFVDILSIKNAQAIPDSLCCIKHLDPAYIEAHTPLKIADSFAYLSYASPVLVVDNPQGFNIRLVRTNVDSNAYIEYRIIRP